MWNKPLGHRTIDFRGLIDVTTHSPKDPREILSTAPMSALQMLAVAIAVGMTGLDGFDVLSIAFAAPGIAAEWGIDRAALGVVLSMELIGMALGAVVLGAVADNFGRRPTVLGCLVLMSLGMLMVPNVQGIPALEVWRFVTGLGIGGVLATNNAIVAEFSNVRHRYVCLALMTVGYPIGAVTGGLIVKQLLHGHDWRSVFYFGGCFTVAFIPLVLLFVPESLHWLILKQPREALQRVNRTLTRMRLEPITTLPTTTGAPAKHNFTEIFHPALLLTTVLATLSYFFHMMTFYFLMKWIPKIIVDMHFPDAQAAGVLIWANVGGATGGTLLGLLSRRVGLKAITITVMLLSTITVILFGRSAPDLSELSMLCAAAGFFTNAGIVGLYAILAQAFPTQVRATGTGFAIGLGRGGAILGPITAGFLFKSGATLPSVALYLAMGSLIAAAILAMLKLKPDAAERSCRPLASFSR